MTEGNGNVFVDNWLSFVMNYKIPISYSMKIYSTSFIFHDKNKSDITNILIFMSFGHNHNQQDFNGKPA